MKIKAKQVQFDNYVEMASPELLWLGESGQPYRGTLYVQYNTTNKITVDMISFKKYITSLRSETVLLEDIASFIAKDLEETLDNDNIAVTVKSAARGGISSTITNGNTNFKDPQSKPLVFGLGV